MVLILQSSFILFQYGFFALVLIFKDSALQCCLDYWVIWCRHQFCVSGELLPCLPLAQLYWGRAAIDWGGEFIFQFCGYLGLGSVNSQHFFSWSERIVAFYSHCYNYLLILNGYLLPCFNVSSPVLECWEGKKGGEHVYNPSSSLSVF